MTREAVPCWGGRGEAVPADRGSPAQPRSPAGLGIQSGAAPAAVSRAGCWHAGLWAGKCSNKLSWLIRIHTNKERKLPRSTTETAEGGMNNRSSTPPLPALSWPADELNPRWCDSCTQRRVASQAWASAGEITREQAGMCRNQQPPAARHAPGQRELSSSSCERSGAQLLGTVTVGGGSGAPAIPSIRSGARAEGSQLDAGKGHGAAQVRH